ncbi:MAG: hypothetical protein ABIG46_08180 [Candidatus Omnitrophota bacterium]|nr:hypothetical protein [Candidatus Omnitrophota bacterium]
MKRQVFLVAIAIMLLACFVIFKYALILNNQNNTLIRNIDDLQKQVSFLTEKIESDKWSDKLNVLIEENKLLKVQIEKLSQQLTGFVSKKEENKPLLKQRGNKGYIIRKR